MLKSQQTISRLRHNLLCAIWCGVLMASFPACSSKNGDTPKNGDTAQVLKRVRVTAATTMDVVDRRSYAADLEASTEITLYPLVAERIVSFPVEEGDRVKKGDVIAKIRAATLKKSIVQMQAEIEALDQNLASQKREMARSSQLYNKAVITEQTLDQLESGFKASLARRKSLEASLSQVEITAGNAVLKSPVDGFVIGKNLEAGDVAIIGAPLCRVVCVDPIKVEVGIIENNMMSIRNGMAVELEVGAIPGKIFHGQIMRILPVVEKTTRTNEARIEIENPLNAELEAPLLKPGMYGTVSIIIERRPDQVAPSGLDLAGNVKDNRTGRTGGYRPNPLEYHSWTDGAHFQIPRLWQNC